MNHTLESLRQGLTGGARRALVAATLVLAAVPALAAPAVVVSNVNGPSSLGNPPYTLGWSFSTNDAITVNALGVFDSGLDGLATRYQVGLWDSGGVLLASATVAAGVSAPLTNQFRYATVAGVALGAGRTYTIGALIDSSADAVLFPGEVNGFSTAAEISFLESRFIDGATLTDPTIGGGVQAGYFGPNFLFSASTNETPEPASLLLVAMAIAALRASQTRRAR